MLALAANTASEWSQKPIVMVAGLAGLTQQAVMEAKTAVDLGYHAGLLSLAALKGQSSKDLIEHCRAVAKEIPLIGFYLQPAVGGMELDVDFWTEFAAIPNVVAIKVAAFNRYRSLDVIRGVVNAKAENRITLYTGNDDHIVLDLLTPFDMVRDGEIIRVRFVGGLLGHWSVWTQSAVKIFEQCKKAVREQNISADLLALDGRVTDCNSAFFDVANDFKGCIAGCHEILRRQGLLEGIWCLDPDEGLSPGQIEQIDRVSGAYPDLNDDTFVKNNLKKWMA
ncbi:Dihydrodipicolinate synthase family protein RB7999 [hydrothermal vent metagenome]|uniref:Dihydrodipicolinate synthase family protein RB7999 n=1 Tax=hydrothermal vent metagenome TaxID=652676 RepID=A0A3B0TJA4_9ZZZZ